MKPPAASTPVPKRPRYRSGSSAETRRAISHLDFSRGCDLWAQTGLISLSPSISLMLRASAEERRCGRKVAREVSG